MHRPPMAQDKVAVVGLGYVGIPLAALLASKGYDVVGIDVLDDRVRKINKGELPLKGDEPGLGALLSKQVRAGRLRASSTWKDCRGRKSVFVCVDTPIDADRKPDYSNLMAAVIGIARNMSKGTMVVVESTLAPGTMTGVIKPAIERESGLRAGTDFGLAHCPERVMPGRLLKNITTYDRIIGGLDKRSQQRACAIYSKLTKGKLHPTDLTTAEIVKTSENTYRDVQIAFANEVALISEKLGADVFEVRRLVNTCPFRDMHMPGAGVGGHCLPKDPWLLATAGKAANPELIPTARAVNDSMPFHVLDLATEALSASGRTVEGSVIAVLGASFLQDSGDSRNSPSLPVVESLKRAEELRVHDPHLEEFAGIKVEKSLNQVLNGADLAIFMVSHKEYLRVSPAAMRRMMRTPTVIDGRNLFDAKKMAKAGVLYRGVGKGSLQ